MAYILTQKLTTKIFKNTPKTLQLEKRGDKMAKTIQKLPKTAYVTTTTIRDYSLNMQELKEEYQLNDKQVKGAFLLATTGMDKKQVAEELGIRRETLYLWLKKDNFLKLYNDLSGFALKSLQGKAIGKLGNLLDSDNEKVVLDAAKFAITTNMKVVEGVDLTKRDQTQELIEILKQEELEGEVEIIVGEHETKEEMEQDELYDPREVMGL